MRCQPIQTSVFDGVIFLRISRAARLLNAGGEEGLDALKPLRQAQNMVRLKIRIDLGKDGLLGPGKAELLERIDQTGSIRKAAVAMDMSYRRAWMLVKETEQIMGAPVIAATTGGAHGGGTALNDLGRFVVEKYRAVEQRAAKAVAGELAALEKLAKGPPRAQNAGKRARPRKK
jgi:molybdate transport system regulatory protein